jgi:hypothetical protein
MQELAVANLSHWEHWTVAVDTIEIRPPVNTQTLAIGFLYSLDIQGLTPWRLSTGVSRTRVMSTCSAGRKIETHTQF